ncbi:hypothetical protein A9Q84_17445 [Halobacteriovorax marinus]|uniref:Uncharacterized protein n=1 Tax=Halobacteriovorax marinus TaxID=97084 RepID=A0A1Y5F334_9BACT|nr:hypothetical protein A9Q84_17445 [Halobacteriovorax marinus]
MKSTLIAIVSLLSVSSFARDMVITCEAQDILNNANISATTISLNEQTNKFEGHVVIEFNRAGLDAVRFEEHLFVEGSYKVIAAGVFGPKEAIFLKYVNLDSDTVKDFNLVVNHPSKRSSYVTGKNGFVYRTKCVEVQTAL